MRAININKQFLRKREDSNVFYAVKTTDFSLERGRLTVLYGASGSGKSTLLNMLAGLQKPTEGKILVGDTELYDLDDKELSVFRNKNIGVVPQGQSMLHTLNVEENILLPVHLYRFKKEAGDRARIEERKQALLCRMNMEELRKVMPSELSGGETKRVSIARALIMDPEIVLADEPTADLDRENADIVMRLFAEAAHEGKEVLVVTHDQEAMKFADIIYRMEQGVIRKEEKDESTEF